MHVFDNDGIGRPAYQLALKLQLGPRAFLHRRMCFVRHRLLTYLTVVFTLPLPLLGVVSARSYVQDEILHRPVGLT